jgi:DNA-binding NtrC family response regulator
MSAFFESRPDPQTSKVLVAVDESHFRKAMKKKLVARGYQVIEVKTGAEAVHAAAGQWPEVVIVDQHMPDVSGLQAATKIKKKRPDIRVIMLAGYGETDQSRGVKNKNVFKCLYKPCGIAELIDTIEAARRERADEIVHQEMSRGFIRRFFGWMISLYRSIQQRSF